MRAVLTYHSIDPSGSVISVDESTLQRHVDFLASGRVRVLPLDDLLEAPDDDDAVALTFDDGFENFATAAWPRLSAAGLPATVFVVSDRTGDDNRWYGDDEPGIPTLPLMEWDTLGRLAEEGLSLGSHTRTHRRCPTLSDAELEDEMHASREEIRARTGAEATSVAYPYGDHDDRSVAAARAAYASAWTTELAVLGAGDDPHRLPRLDMFYLRDADRLAGFGSRGFAAYVSGRAFVRRMRARVTKAIGGARS